MAPVLLINSRYSISEKPVGQGGMGVVYKAYDAVTKRHVALKTIRGIVEPAALELFVKEWTVLARLSHPNIVDILDSGEFEEDGQRRPFFVMPLLPGVTLEYLIKNASQRLTVERTAEIMSQTCRGLQAAHEQGLVHRDLKPSNIFVLEDDTVKVIDFGVVHLSGAQSMTGLKGTLQYMSPEQLEMKPATPISDIFALGVVCYEALTGRKPFARQTEAETADAVRRYIPPPISEINPTVSQLVSRVVHKAMAKQPWHRYSSARDFAETLQKAVNNQPIERFDRTRIQPRIERIKRAHSEGDHQFAQEILNELEAEGNIDPEMTVLRIQIEQAVRQKTIRQLLDSARTRLEEEEYPLALQKIQEVLDIDPQNVDATNLRAETETLRSKTQIESWFRLVRQHIDNQSYSQARQGLQQILKLNANDTQARALLAEIDRKEQEIVKLRTEKESLYQSAVGSYQNGEISAALSKLERILDLNRRSPDSAAPERDAQYQSLYNQVRTERETARSSYAEGRRHLADRNFTKAAEICDDFLKKYPNDPMFQALKLEVEEQQRQEQSAYIAEVGRRVEAEADLDRRVNVLREAVERYPNEPQFQQALRLIRDRRDLVNSIVAKARQYEERGQFNDALGQWDILRNIYPQYPGLEFEVQRVVRRREDQAREESKARWVEQIDRSIETGAHQRAVEVAHNALAEFPDDAELAGLERIARQGLERSIEAQKWLSEGQRLCLERQYAEGLQALRKASELDPRNQVTRDALLNALVEQARSVMAQDWRAAEPLVQQALQIDPGHPLAKNLQALVLDYKRQQIVNECVAQAREYQVNGNLPAALAKVEDVLAAWPNEVRLLQLRSTLRNQLVELQRATSAATAPPEPVVPPPPARPVVPPPPSITETLIDPDLGQSTAGVKGINLRPSERNRGVAVETPIPSTPPHAAPPVRRKSPAAYWQKAMTSLQTLGRGARRWSVWQWSAAASVPVILLAGYLIAHRPGRTGGVGLSEYEVSLDSNVIGAQYLVDGQPVVSLPVKLKQGEHRVEALAAGYRREVASFTLSPGAARPFVVRLQLEPEPRHLRLVSDLKSGSVVLDNKPAVDLLDGAFELEDLPPGDHTLKIVDRSRELAQFTFSSDPGGMVSLTAPVQVKDLSVVVVSSLANRARVYGSSSLKANLEGQPLQPIPGEGLELKNLSGSNNELSIDDGKGSRHVPIELGNAPLLNIFLGAGSDSGTVVVQANVPAAHLVVDGQPVRQMLRNGRATLSLSPKEHLIRLSQEGYQTSTDVKVDVKKGETQMVRLELKPLASSTALVIQGTPEAEVWIDGSRAGATDATGVYTRTELAPGSHTITVKKANFEEQVFQENAVAGGSLNLSANLKALGTLNIRVNPATARVTYKREGEAQSHEGRNNEAVHVAPGRYQISARADRRRDRTEMVTVSADRPVIIDWSLEPAAENKVPARALTTADYFEDPAHWKQQGDRWTHDAPDTTWMRTNQGVFYLDIFRQQTKGFFGKKIKRVDWVIDYKGEGDRIAYWLDDRSLHRKVLVNGKGQEEKRPLPEGSSEVCHFQIEILADRVVIKSGGKTLDEVKRNASESFGKFGFRGEVSLGVRQAK